MAKRCLLLIAGLLCGLVIVTGCNDDDNRSAPVRIGYVYHADAAVAADFHDYLETQGYVVDLFEIDGLAVADLSDVDLFMVDHNAGSGDWDATNAAVLTDTGRPIIGNGDGVAVFDPSEPFLDWGQCALGGTSHSLLPMTTAHPVWNEPVSLLVTAGVEVQVLTAALEPTVLYGAGAPADVALLGQSTSHSSYYVLAIEDGNHALWGFGKAGPSDYTEAGRQLLVNLIESVL